MRTIFGIILIFSFTITAFAMPALSPAQIATTAANLQAMEQASQAQVAKMAAANITPPHPVIDPCQYFAATWTGDAATLAAIVMAANCPGSAQ